MSRLEKLNQNKNVRVVHERTKEEREPRKRSGFLIILIIIILAGLGYLLLFSGAFDIKRKEVTGYSNPLLIEEIVDSYCESGRLGRNIFFFDVSGLENAIKGDSGISSVKVRKMYPDKIKIEIKEPSPSIAWKTAGESFLVDERGYVIEKNNIKSLPQVFDNANIRTSLGERVASPTFIKFIIDVSENFEPVTGHKIEKIIIYDILSDVHIKSISGWTVYLDATKDPVSQLENLLKVLKEAKAEGHTKIKYIDMRLQDKVFYK